ncbi:unnamed protein product [Schistocephalus solidus]|uniref:Uncharacterized protein n=1 Tax=Schistocephalus solidus TaxID=70667 RepID=A0A183SS88_SCHSO|nr:unnamed protein product [Schistocephalus solidus]
MFAVLSTPLYHLSLSFILSPPLFFFSFSPFIFSSSFSTPIFALHSHLPLPSSPTAENSYSEGDMQPRYAGGGGCRLHFLWSGRPQAERCNAGVAFAIWNDIVGGLPCLPHGINDRLMSLHLPLRGNQFALILSAYADPMTSSDEAKDKFYEDLHSL